MNDTVDIVLVDSRSKDHYEWVQRARDSILDQSYEVGLIEIDNVLRDKTIGRCWNEGAKESHADWIFFLDDDDWIVEDLIHVLVIQADKLIKGGKNPHAVLSFMTAFDNNGRYSRMDKASKGIIKRNYLLEYPFDESLTSGVDLAWWNKMHKRGHSPYVIPYHYGYYYRQHQNKTCNVLEIA